MKNIICFIIVLCLNASFVVTLQANTYTDTTVTPILSKISPSDSIKLATAKADSLSKIKADSLAKARVDSLSKASIKVDMLSRDLRKIEEKMSMQDILLYSALGISVLSLILFVYFNSNTKKKHSIIWDNIRNTERGSSTIELESKLRGNYSDVSKKITDLREIVKILKEDHNITATKLKDLSLQVNAISSFNTNVEKQGLVKKKRDNEIIKEIESKPKGIFYNVDYFVESGIVKFRETDQATPFYIEKYTGKSELTINEDVSASSNYSESIRRCFDVEGQMSGKYKNIKPAVCNYDDFTQTWKLADKGLIRSY